MKMNRRFLAGLFVLVSVVLGTNSAQAVTQTLTFNATADNAYAIYMGTATSATQSVGGAANFSTNSQIFTPESYTTTAQDTDYIYIAAWSDHAVKQGFLADITDLGTGFRTFSGGPSPWLVTATGINLSTSSPAPTLADITTQIGLANAGTNPSGGWNSVTPSALTNFQGGIHGVVVSGIASNASWMWWNSGNDPSAEAPFSPGFNHSEYLIFRLPVFATSAHPPIDPVDVPTLPEWAAIIMATLLMGLAIRAQARNRV